MRLHSAFVSIASLSVLCAQEPPARAEHAYDPLAVPEHAVAPGLALTLTDGKRNPNHHRAILAISTAFWDTHLRGDAAARAWLHGPGPKTVLEEADRWQLAPRQPPAK